MLCAHPVYLSSADIIDKRNHWFLAAYSHVAAKTKFIFRKPIERTLSCSRLSTEKWHMPSTQTIVKSILYSKSFIAWYTPFIRVPHSLQSQSKAGGSKSKREEEKHTEKIGMNSTSNGDNVSLVLCFSVFTVQHVTDSDGMCFSFILFVLVSLFISFLFNFN